MRGREIERELKKAHIESESGEEGGGERNAEAFYPKHFGSQIRMCEEKERFF